MVVTPTTPDRSGRRAKSEIMLMSMIGTRSEEMEEGKEDEDGSLESVLYMFESLLVP